MKTADLLFPKVESTKASLLLLASRLVFGLTFASHGLDKLQHFADTAAHFPAPFGLSGEVAVGLSIFLYLVIFVLSWFAGAGRFSVDGIIRSKFSH